MQECIRIVPGANGHTLTFSSRSSSIPLTILTFFVPHPFFFMQSLKTNLTITELVVEPDQILCMQKVSYVTLYNHMNENFVCLSDLLPWLSWVSVWDKCPIFIVWIKRKCNALLAYISPCKVNSWINEALKCRTLGACYATNLAG